MTNTDTQLTEFQQALMDAAQKRWDAHLIWLIANRSNQGTRAMTNVMNNTEAAFKALVMRAVDKKIIEMSYLPQK
jgi:hypothetical protein